MHRSVREYLEKFDKLPAIRMMQCSGENDKQYIAMCEEAVKRGTPVTEEDYEKYSLRTKTRGINHKRTQRAPRRKPRRFLM